MKANPSSAFRLLHIACFLLLFAYILPVYSTTIIIDNKTYSVDTLANYKVGPGSQYTSLRLKSTSRLDVFFLKVDASNPYISYKAVLGRDSIYGGEQPSAMAKRKSKEGAVYFAGTNGDFYSTTGYVGYPVAGCMVESEVAKIPTTARKIIAFDDNKIPTIGAMNYNGNVQSGDSSWTINSVNHLREDNKLVLFNQHNGKVTRTNAFGTEVLVQLLVGQSWGVNKTVRVKVIKTEINKGNMAIPKGYAVLSGHGTAATSLNALAVNDEIDITLNMVLDGQTSSYTQVVGGDNRNAMLKDGVVETAQVWAENHPRTAIGYSQDLKTIIHCVVDGRGASAGVTTKQLAELMQSAGAYTAFNMDGGGSSSLYVKEFGQMNTPSDGVERAVANGIFAVSSAPTDITISEIKSYTRKIQLPRYGVFMPKFIGYNQYGALINKDLQGVVLSCTPEVGFIAADGRFVASGTQGGILTAKYNNVETQLQIELVTSAEIAFRLDSVLIDNRKDYSIQIQSQIGLNTMDVLPAALTWTASDATVCSFEDGNLIGLKNGSTWVYGTLGDFKDTIKVTVEIPTSGSMIADEFVVNNWLVESSSALNASFNTENLPVTWSHGAAVNYIYTATRAPYIKFLQDLALYSLPDTIKVLVNIGDITLSKVILSLRANNSILSVTKEFTTIPKNTDTQILIPTSSLFDSSDIAIYPVWFNYINFYLGSQTENQAYTLAMKEIVLCYKGVEISGTSSVLMSKLSVYPNPVKGSELHIRLDESGKSKVTVELLTMLGQSVRSKQYNANLHSEIVFPIGDLKSGTYFVRVLQGEKVGTAKILIR